MIIPWTIPLTIALIIPWGSNYSHYSFKHSQLFTFISSTSLPDLSGYFTFWIAPIVSKHGNEEQRQFISDYSHQFAYGQAVETQLSWLILWLFLIIPLIILNYSQLFLLCS